jgi:diaminohydroxyphosphoribosylaminopyrimidine deaminase/5-amino-6-(5-phosphoribosylamino)uracil reductase
MNEQEYMRRAIALARQGAGWTSPNPMVGAVIVKDGRIIGEGYHQKCGELHAERNALAALTESAQGATMYVTLEPCCHYGRTPPCTQAILEHGLARVVIGSRDPNPLVAGKGAAQLRQQGVSVETDFLRAECDALNPVFFHYITTGRPYVVMKFAMTLDGKIAAYTGQSQWITGETARNHVHSLRGRYSAVLAGIGTVLADDPMLNCRQPGGHQPLRVIADSNLRIPLDCKLCQTAGEYETLVACTKYDPEKAKALENLGVRVLHLPGADGRVDLRALMEQLGKDSIDSVLIEGGGQLHEAALQAGIVNHVCAYIAPKLLGGRDAKTPVEGQGAAHPDQAAALSNLQITQLGQDLLLEYDVTGGLRDVYWNR